MKMRTSRIKPSPRAPGRFAQAAKHLASRSSSLQTTATPAFTPPPATILLAVTGMSPAVLTETVWALAHEKPPIIPDRVVVLSTQAGGKAIERELLDPPVPSGDSIWQQLRKRLLGDGACQTARLILDPPRIITAPQPRAGRAEFLQDIRQPSDNAAAANFILEEVRRIVENVDTRLVASLAGGRKTMGALLYAAMTLLGRETDRLTHVLINEPFEDSRLQPRFFFPPAEPVIYRLPGVAGSASREILSTEACIELADVPFVPLRNLFERDLTKRPGSFHGLVQRCRKEVAELVRREISLVVWRSKPLIQVNGVGIHLSPFQHVLVLFLAEGLVAGRPLITKQANAVEPVRQFGSQIYNARDKEDFGDWRDGARLPGDFDEQRLRKLLNEIRVKLRDAGQDAAAMVSVLPTRGRFSLDLPSSAITFRQ